MTRRRGRPAAPRIAALCTTHHDGRAVEQALLPLRGVVDEIVVGADDRVPEEDLACYGRVADALFTYPYTGPNEFRGWLREQTDADWILFLDGDEVPSARLLARLPALVADRGIAAYELRREWLYPDPSRFLAAAPWEPDHQTRLVRNDDRLWFPSTKHTGPATTGTTKRIDEPVFHLDLLLTTFEERRAKVARYDAEHFGLFTKGRPTNELYYLPELRSGLANGEVAEVDRARVERIVAAVGSGSGPGPARRRGGSVDVVGRATPEDIRRTVPWQPFGPDDARVTIALLRPPPAGAAAGSRFVVDVSVGNDGTRTWPAGTEQQPALRLSYHWDRGGSRVVADGLRTAFPHPVRGGEAASVAMVVEAPGEEGDHELVVDVVVEGDRWFGRELAVPVRVTESVASRVAASTVDGLVLFDAVSRLRIEVDGPHELERLLAVDEDVVPTMLAHIGAPSPGVLVQVGADGCTAALAAHAAATGGSLVVVEDDLDAVGDALGGPAPATVVVTTPSRGSRVPALAAVPALRSLVREPVEVLVGLAWRDVVLALARAWSEVDGLHVRGFVPVGRGLLVAQLDPPSP